jgi:hypothetical protein
LCLHKSSGKVVLERPEVGKSCLALLRLDATHRDDDASVLLDLRQPLLVVFHLTARSEQGTVRLKHVQDLAARDPQPKLRSSLQHFLVPLIDALMLAQAQPPHQQHAIEPIAEAWQHQRISRRAAVRPSMSRAAIARVDQPDHSVQPDHRALRQRHRLPQRPFSDHLRRAQTARLGL